MYSAQTHGVSSGPININRHLHTWTHIIEFQIWHAIVCIIWKIRVCIVAVAVDATKIIVSFSCDKAMEINFSIADFPTPIHSVFFFSILLLLYNKRVLLSHERENSIVNYKSYAQINVYSYVMKNNNKFNSVNTKQWTSVLFGEFVLNANDGMCHDRIN